ACPGRHLPLPVDPHGGAAGHEPGDPRRHLGDRAAHHPERDDPLRAHADREDLTVARGLLRHAVPILFAGLCLFGIVVAKITPPFLMSEMLVRMSRNSVLVLSLLIPILAGLGLNFGIVIGAMAGQIGAILIVHWGIPGIGGFALAWAIATPIAILLGIATGSLFNRAKEIGRASCRERGWMEGGAGAVQR